MNVWMAECLGVAADFTTIADPVWNEATSIRGQVVTNGNFQQAAFDAWNNAARQNGRGIKSLRLDPANNGAAGDVDRVAIDWPSGCEGSGARPPRGACVERGKQAVSGGRLDEGDIWDRQKRWWS